MEVNFSNLKELKQRITPAMNSKIKELRSNNYLITTTEDIWQYLKQKKWKNANNLTLYDIINDILNIDNEAIEKYSINRRETNDKIQ